MISFTCSCARASRFQLVGITSLLTELLVQGTYPPTQFLQHLSHNTSTTTTVPLTQRTDNNVDHPFPACLYRSLFPDALLLSGSTTTTAVTKTRPRERRLRRFSNSLDQQYRPTISTDNIDQQYRPTISTVLSTSLAAPVYLVGIDAQVATFLGLIRKLNTTSYSRLRWLSTRADGLATFEQLHTCPLDLVVRWTSCLSQSRAAQHTALRMIRMAGVGVSWTTAKMKSRSQETLRRGLNLVRHLLPTEAPKLPRSISKINC